jgi:hypothetical protein
MHEIQEDLTVCAGQPMVMLLRQPKRRRSKGHQRSVQLLKKCHRPEIRGPRSHAVRSHSHAESLDILETPDMLDVLDVLDNRKLQLK